MADKDPRFHPSAPILGINQSKSDEESAATEQRSKELRNKKRMKRLAWVSAFAVIQIVIIFAISFTLLRADTPKFRIGSVTIEHLTVINSDSESPSLDMKFEAEIAVKNTNFWEFKFGDSSNISFVYEDSQVGSALLVGKKVKAKARSTKKMNVTGTVMTMANSELESDIESGSLSIKSEGKLRGKVHLLKFIKMKRTAQMNCTITVHLEDRVVQDLECK